MKHPPQDWMFEGSWVDGDYDIVVLYDGRWLHTHGIKKCLGRSGPCCIHSPSDHHMRAWPQSWRPDLKVMERLCPHGQGHPDPDGYGPDVQHDICDGCCDPRGRTYSVLASS